MAFAPEQVIGLLEKGEGGEVACGFITFCQREEASWWDGVRGIFRAY